MTYQYYGYGQQPNMLPQQQILQVNGKPKDLLMAPNSSVIALDAPAMVAWICVSDGIGSVTMTPFDMTPHQEPQQVDANTFDKRLTAIEEAIKKLAGGNENESAATGA